MKMLSAYLLVLALLGPAHAQEHWQAQALLADMFPSADHFEPVVVDVDKELARSLRSRAGAPVPAQAYTFQAAYRDDALLGYVIFDAQTGQHQPIDFAVQLSPDHVVMRQEVVVYREKYGGGVADPRFRAQFQGLTAADPVVAGRDVDIVSGATYSSRAMAVGVKRDLVLAGLLPPGSTP